MRPLRDRSGSGDLVDGGLRVSALESTDVPLRWSTGMRPRNAFLAIDGMALVTPAAVTAATTSVRRGRA
jgi:hypothetical protein